MIIVYGRDGLPTLVDEQAITVLRICSIQPEDEVRYFAELIVNAGEAVSIDTPNYASVEQLYAEQGGIRSLVQTVGAL